MSNLDDALNFEKQATTTPAEWIKTVQTKRNYDPTQAWHFKALTALYAAAHEPVPPPPPPPPPPSFTVSQNVTEGQAITAPIVWEATPSAAVVKVEFYVDGTLKWTEGASPYRYNGDGGSFDPAAFADGAHTLIASATDSTGRTASAMASVTTKKPVTPPPPTGSRQWGFSLSPPGGNWGNLTEAAGRRQLQEALALGMTCPRISGHAWAAQACRDMGFKQWIVILGAGKSFADDTGTINYCKAWPEAIIEPGNELNIGGSPWTPEALADRHIAWYKAVKASGVKNLLSMASVGNSYSTQGNLTPLDFNKRVAARGMVLGNGFDVGNYHSYGANIDSYDQWMHIYTPDGSGASLQSIFHNPPYYITEFNLHTSDANAKAAALKNYMDRIETLSNCLGGHVYTILNTTDAGTDWGLVLDSYAKIQPPWDTYHAEATGVALAPTTAMKAAARVEVEPDHETDRPRPVWPEIPEEA